MGTWGKKIWESDGAVDFFAGFFEAEDKDACIAKGLQFSDKYGEIRAAAYLLGTLGVNGYVWPGDPKKLAENIQKAIQRLKAMAEPGSEYLSLWGGDEEIKQILQQEIAALEALHADKTN